jgi:hypothetical protein
VSLSLGRNPTGGTLSGNADQISSEPTVTWQNLRIDKPGSYTLVALASTGTGSTSQTFTVVP